MNFVQLLTIMRARWKSVLYTLLGVVAVTLVVSLIVPPKYKAMAEVLVDIQSPNAFTPIGGVAGYLAADALRANVATQVDIITSDRVAQRAVKMLKLDQDPELKQKWYDATGGKGQPVVWIADLLKKKLEVKPSHDNSSIIDMTFTGNSPSFAAMAANAFLKAYIDTSVALKVDPARQYAGWFEERLKAQRVNLEQAQARLSDYQQQAGIASADERSDFESSKTAELSAQLALAEGEAADTQSRQAHANGTMTDVMASPVIQALKVEIVKAQARLHELGGNLGRNHPAYKALENEIAGLKQNLDAETRQIMGSIDTANRVSKQKENMLRAAIEARKQKALQLKKQRDQLAVLQRDVDTAQKAYDLVALRAMETNLESQATRTNISVLTPATEPAKQSSPKIRLNLAIAAFLGLLLGIASALFMEMLDRRVRTIEDLEIGLNGLPVLAQIHPLRSQVSNGPYLLGNQLRMLK